MNLDLLLCYKNTIKSFFNFFNPITRINNKYSRLRLARICNPCPQAESRQLEFIKITNYNEHSLQNCANDSGLMQAINIPLMKTNKSK